VTYTRVQGMGDPEWSHLLAPGLSFPIFKAVRLWCKEHFPELTF
jgi:hypothetical protein